MKTTTSSRGGLLIALIAIGMFGLILTIANTPVPAEEPIVAQATVQPTVQATPTPNQTQTYPEGYIIVEDKTEGIVLYDQRTDEIIQRYGFAQQFLVSAEQLILQTATTIRVIDIASGRVYWEQQVLSEFDHLGQAYVLPEQAEVLVARFTGPIDTVLELVSYDLETGRVQHTQQYKPTNPIKLLPKLYNQHIIAYGPNTIELYAIDQAKSQRFTITQPDKTLLTVVQHEQMNEWYGLDNTFNLYQISNLNINSKPSVTIQSIPTYTNDTFINPSSIIANRNGIFFSAQNPYDLTYEVVHYNPQDQHITTNQVGVSTMLELRPAPEGVWLLQDTYVAYWNETISAPIELNYPSRNIVSLDLAERPVAITLSSLEISDIATKTLVSNNETLMWYSDPLKLRQSEFKPVHIYRLAANGAQELVYNDVIAAFPRPKHPPVLLIQTDTLSLLDPETQHSTPIDYPPLPFMQVDYYPAAINGVRSQFQPNDLYYSYSPDGQQIAWLTTDNHIIVTEIATGIQQVYPLSISKGISSQTSPDGGLFQLVGWHNNHLILLENNHNLSTLDLENSLHSSVATLKPSLYEFDYDAINNRIAYRTLADTDNQQHLVKYDLESQQETIVSKANIIQYIEFHQGTLSWIERNDTITTINIEQPHATIQHVSQLAHSYIGPINQNSIWQDDQIIQWIETSPTFNHLNSLVTWNIATNSITKTQTTVNINDWNANRTIIETSMGESLFIPPLWGRIPAGANTPDVQLNLRKDIFRTFNQIVYLP